MGCILTCQAWILESDDAQLESSQTARGYQEAKEWMYGQQCSWQLTP